MSLIRWSAGRASGTHKDCKENGVCSQSGKHRSKRPLPGLKHQSPGGELKSRLRHVYCKPSSCGTSGSTQRHKIRGLTAPGGRVAPRRAAC